MFLFLDITHARFTPNTGGNQGNAKPVMQNTVETFPNELLKNPAFSHLEEGKIKQNLTKNSTTTISKEICQKYI